MSEDVLGLTSPLRQQVASSCPLGEKVTPIM